jgi:hypothetical protein
MVAAFRDLAAMPKTDTELYRAIKNGTFKDDLFVADDEPATGLLYPRFEATTYIDGFGKEQVSNADVTVHPLPTGDEVEAGGGTSMFDVDGWFGFGHWKYFRVPNGTEYPENLVVKRGRSRRTNKSGNRAGYHYQIEPRNRMTVVAYKGALDNFARSAVVRAIALAKGK